MVATLLKEGKLEVHTRPDAQGAQDRLSQPFWEGKVSSKHHPQTWLCLKVHAELGYREKKTIQIPTSELSSSPCSLKLQNMPAE